FAINAGLRQHGLVLAHVDSSALGLEGAVEYCASQGFSAAIVCPRTAAVDSDRMKRAQSQMPIVALDQAPKGVESDVIACDGYEAAQIGVRHLTSVGRKRIAITGRLDTLESTQSRFAGYLDAMFVENLQPEPRDFLFTRTSGRSAAYTAGLEHRLLE